MIQKGRNAAVHELVFGERAERTTGVVPNATKCISCIMAYNDFGSGITENDVLHIYTENLAS